MLGVILEPIVFILCLLPRWFIGWLVIFGLGYAWGHSDASSTCAERVQKAETRVKVAAHARTRAPAHPAAAGVQKSP